MALDKQGSLDICWSNKPCQISVKRRTPNYPLKVPIYRDNENEMNIFTLVTLTIFMKFGYNGVASNVHQRETTTRSSSDSLQLCPFSKWELLLKERICSQRERILSFKSSSWIFSWNTLLSNWYNGVARTLKKVTHIKGRLLVSSSKSK